MSQKDQQQQFIISAPLSKVMWRLSLPAIAAMVLFGLNAFMDTVYVGQLMDETALAGIAIAYPLTSVLIGIGSWSGTGGANVLSIALGAGDLKKQATIVPNATLFAIVSTCAFAIPGYLLSEPLIRMMGGHGAILQAGVTYFEITMIGSPAWVYALTLNMIIRGEGKMKTAATMMIFGLLANLVLTPLFIIKTGLGVAGAAWATNIGMVIYSSIGYLYFIRQKASFPSNARSLSLDGATFKAIMKMGFPGFILSVMGLVQAMVVFNAIVSNGTDEDLAFFAAANRILFFLMTPLFGLMRALQPVAGINFGAQEYDRVKGSFKLFTKTGFYVIAPFWILLTLFPEAAVRLALPEMPLDNSDLLNFRVYMLVLPILPIVFMALTLFPAINQSKYSSIIGMARQLIFYVPVMLLLPRYLGIYWVYLGSTLIDFAVTIWLLAVVWKLFKKLNQPETSNPSSWKENTKKS